MMLFSFRLRSTQVQKLTFELAYTARIDLDHERDLAHVLILSLVSVLFQL